VPLSVAVADEQQLPMAAWAYAYDKVGFMVLPDTRRLFTARQLARWDAAVQEYLDSRSKEDNGTE
jgi:hypothetical protein